MHFVPVADVVVLPPRVAGRVLPERHRNRLDDDVVERDLHLLHLATRPRRHLQRLPGLPDPLHVHLGGEVEGGHRADRLGQPPGDGLPDLAEGDICKRRGGREAGKRVEAGGTAAPTRAGAANGAVSTSACHNPALRPRPLYRPEIESPIGGNPARQGRGLEPHPCLSRWWGAGRRERLATLGVAGAVTSGPTGTEGVDAGWPFPRCPGFPASWLPRCLASPASSGFPASPASWLPRSFADFLARLADEGHRLRHRHGGAGLDHVLEQRPAQPGPRAPSRPCRSRPRRARHRRRRGRPPASSIRPGAPPPWWGRGLP